MNIEKWDLQQISAVQKVTTVRAGNNSAVGNKRQEDSNNDA